MTTTTVKLTISVWFKGGKQKFVWNKRTATCWVSRLIVNPTPVTDPAPRTSVSPGIKRSNTDKLKRNTSLQPARNGLNNSSSVFKKKVCESKLCCRWELTLGLGRRCVAAILVRHFSWRQLRGINGRNPRGPAGVILRQAGHPPTDRWGCDTGE